MKAGLKAEWEIEVCDKNGKLVKRVTKDADLIVWNWLKCASAITVPSSFSNAILLVNQYGHAVEIEQWRILWILGVYQPKPKIAVGSGVNPVTKEDYKLAEEWGRSGMLTPEIAFPSPAECEIRFSASFSSNVSRILGEIGIFLDHIAGGYPILVCRDIVSPPINIPAGGTVNVRYTIKSEVEG